MDSNSDSKRRIEIPLRYPAEAEDGMLGAQANEHGCMVELLRWMVSMSKARGNAPLSYLLEMALLQAQGCAAEEMDIQQ
ncbi:hypothetical protein M8997_006380 [Phyllobacterium sp. 21LDTY02-6]|jgi:hypothetical protein|uniref:hypothetical protein n=1 Tax=Phyllobacterium sp. 21LDTY02-6 TaxID=2944903 RepID=UPI002022932A|nr:hypothetical protein [Phyllobacterium sp. 21LDTY02-6]MCO4316804.1 hypothetical protein [Phyllobacterium sp. 21LDTY02-6]